MLKVAITGNIASGKSCVETILSSKGFDVYDTDSIAHDILSTSFKVREAFNDFDISNYKGEISREKLGRVVFLNPEKKKVLESIIHPEVKNELNRIFEFNSGKEFVFVAIPLLFEAHFEDLFDKSILVMAMVARLFITMKFIFLVVRIVLIQNIITSIMERLGRK